MRGMSTMSRPFCFPHSVATRLYLPFEVEANYEEIITNLLVILFDKTWLGSSVVKLS